MINARTILNNLCLAIEEAELGDEAWNIIGDRYNEAMNFLNDTDRCDNCLMDGGTHMWWCIDD